MFKNNSKRKRLSDLLIPGIIFAVIGAVFAFQGIRDYNNLNGDLLNLNTASVSDLADGKYVEINVEYANYSFCENVETTNYVFKKTTEQYYLINALENEWKGDASKAYKARYESLKPAFKNAKDLMDELSKNLNASAKIMEDTDTKIASQLK